MRVTRGISAPKKAGDAGYDLEADHQANILPFSSEDFYCASVELPPGHCGIIIGRSSINAIGLLCIPGLVDEGYRGPIKVMLQNLGAYARSIEKGTRIAQMVIVRYGNFPIQYVDKVREDTERGTDGFGSTGK